MDAKDHLDTIIDLLERAYGSPRHDNKDDPLDELIYIKLSQQTNAAKFRNSYHVLREQYPKWEGIETAAEAELERVLRPLGLQRRRARDLQRLARAVRTDRGDLDLSWLSRVPASDVIAYLTQLPGIGIKTAYCVAMYSFGHDVLPVDVHVQRVSERIGVLPHGLSDLRKHETLNSLVPVGRRYAYHVNCVAHGRQVCRKAPKCAICPIRNFCRFYVQDQLRACNDSRTPCEPQP